MKISIALASYNGENFILDQLESFASQTKLPDEVIISDDCSTDNTISLIEKFSLNAPFKIKIYRNDSNLGYSRNFNNALIRTTGELVFLSDQDDVWFDDKIEKIYQLAISEDSLLIMNNAEITDSFLNKTGINKLEQIRSLGKDQNKFVMGCCAAIKRELLDLVLPIHRDFPAHDTWISWFAEYMELKKISTEVMQYYRRHDSNESKYLANNINKTSKINQILLKAKELTKSNKPELFDAELALSIFNKNINNLLIKNKSHRLFKELEKVSQVSFKNLSKIRYRLKIRKSYAHNRVIMASFFYLNGGYREFSGMFSLLSDIVAR